MQNGCLSVVRALHLTPKYTQQKYYIMKPQFKPEEIYLDLSKLSEERQRKVIALLPEPEAHNQYQIIELHFMLSLYDGNTWLVYGTEIKNKTELTYSQFLDMMGESKEKSKVIENSEKELINNDGTLYIGEGLENYYKDQLERTGKFKVVSIDATSEEVVQVENILKYLANRNNELAEKPCFENTCRMIEINRVTQMIKSNQ